MRIATGTGAIPVALKVTGLPESVPAVAPRELPPGSGPSTQLPTDAIPFRSVTASAPVMVPPPPVTANVTVTPFTGTLSASMTLTDGGTATAPLSGAL